MAIFFAMHPSMWDTSAHWVEAYGGAAVTLGNIGTPSKPYIRFSDIMLFSSSNVPNYPASTSTFIWEGWFYHTNTGTQIPIFQLFEGGTFHLGIYKNSSNQIFATRAGTTTLGTSGTALDLNTWVFLQVKVVIHDTTGSVLVHVDGVEHLNLNNVDTRNGGTSGLVNGYRQWHGSGANDWGAWFVADDSGSDYNDMTLVMKDLEVIKPNGAGNSTQFTPSAGANYQTVDETPLDDTDYNDASTDAFKDTFTMGDLTGDVADIKAVCPFAIAEKTDASATSLNCIARHSSSEAAGADRVLTQSSMKFVQSIAHVNPSTSSPWTESEVNAMEAGYEASI